MWFGDIVLSSFSYFEGVDNGVKIKITQTSHSNRGSGNALKTNLITLNKVKIKKTFLIVRCKSLK